MQIKSLSVAAFAAVAVISLGAPAIGSAGLSGGDQLADAAKKKCGKKGKGKRASAAKKKGKKCGKPVTPAPSTPPVTPPVTPTGDTRITLTNYIEGFMADDSIVASVASTNSACVSNRTLTLFEETGATDEVRATATVANAAVTFTFPPQTDKDLFYAVAGQETVGGVQCAAGISNVWEFDD